MNRAVIALSVVSLILLLTWGLVLAPNLWQCYAPSQDLGINWCDFLTYELRMTIDAIAVATGVVALVAAAQSHRRRWFALILAVLVFYVLEFGGLVSAIGCAIAAPRCIPTQQGFPDFVDHLADADHLLALLLPLTTAAYSVLIMSRERPRPLEGLEVSSLDDPDDSKLPGQRAEQ